MTPEPVPAAPLTVAATLPYLAAGLQVAGAAIAVAAAPRRARGLVAGIALLYVGRQLDAGLDT